MPVDKSDKTASHKGKTYIYKYSHAEHINVRGKIWLRHIWVRQDKYSEWRPSYDENRLMEFEPTDEPFESQPEKKSKLLSLRDHIRKFGEDTP